MGAPSKEYIDSQIAWYQKEIARLQAQLPNTSPGLKPQTRYLIGEYKGKIAKLRAERKNCKK